MRTVGSAHEDSLPLIHLIKELEGKPASAVIDAMTSYITSRPLKEDIEVSVVFCDGDRKVQLEALTTYGHDVLEEIVFGCDSEPCPIGHCEFSRGVCLWCGKFQH